MSRPPATETMQKWTFFALTIIVGMLSYQSNLLLNVVSEQRSLNIEITWIKKAITEVQHEQNNRLPLFADLSHRIERLERQHWPEPRPGDDRRIPNAALAPDRRRFHIEGGG